MAKYVIFMPTLIAGGDLVPRRGVTGAGVYPAAGAAIAGVTTSNAKLGDDIKIDAIGTTEMETGAAIPELSQVQVDATGRAVPYTNGVIIGRMAPMQKAATKAGVVVEVTVRLN